MRTEQLTTLRRGAWRTLALSLFATSALSAQTRLTLPEGSVIIVRTATPLESSNAQVGQAFGTFVVDTVRLDSYTVIPSGSRIRGTITFAQAATRSQSGVIEVNFDRLILPDGTTYPITGKLTSTDAAERRQIDQDPNNNRVVLVGGRGGIGAAIAGAGGGSSSNILTALGGLLSEGRNVSVPAGTRLAVQLEQPLSLRARGSARAADQYTVYTTADRIRAAQQALQQQNYYHGQINGVLNNATQQAIFNYQIDKGMTATGNLDWRTARSLGIITTSGSVGGNVGGGLGGSRYGAVLSLDNATSLRRNAQTVLSRIKSDLSVSSLGGTTANRSYSTADIDLLFAISAFADNAMLYENMIRNNGNNDASAMAGRALINAARNVDNAMNASRPSSYTVSAWNSVKRQLGLIDSSYSNTY